MHANAGEPHLSASAGKHREVNREGGASSKLTVHIHPAVVSLDQFLHKMEPKAAAAHPPGRSGVSCVEWIKDAADAVLVNAASGVNDGHADSVGALLIPRHNLD
jgi:hypothetical protein